MFFFLVRGGKTDFLLDLNPGRKDRMSRENEIEEEEAGGGFLLRELQWKSDLEESEKDRKERQKDGRKEKKTH